MVQESDGNNMFRELLSSKVRNKALISFLLCFQLRKNLILWVRWGEKNVVQESDGKCTCFRELLPSNVVYDLLDGSFGDYVRNYK